MFDKCTLISTQGVIGFSVMTKTATWAEDKLFNVNMCNMRIPTGRPSVEVVFLQGGSQVFTSGAVPYSKDLPAKAPALLVATGDTGPITKGFPMSLMWTLSPLGKVFTNDSKIAVTFPAYYNAEIGPGLRCFIGPNSTAMKDTYCNVQKGSDLRLEIFG